MDITVFNVDVVPTGDQASLVFTTRVGDSEALAVHVEPVEALENVAAEYGIDPADRDTLVDVLLYRPHLPPGALDHTHPRHLYNADTVDDARAHLLECVAQVKGDGKIVSVAGESPEQGLAEHAPRLARSGMKCPVTFAKECAPIDRAVIAEKRKLVDLHRAGRRAGRGETRPTRSQQATPATFGPSTEERIARARTARVDAEEATERHPARPTTR